ncbi:hypothetical protein D0T11_06885 [Hymenobacter rubripertinctus]|uniref:Uncharacterized protein n=1 Tax=Hymenobacter rubripertinctus TaxID=2029981 RepID=A0A418R2B6_9BACT|nr:hypothetical protein D0T11_06885 [Hymenobacter rubripertinctus]
MLLYPATDWPLLFPLPHRASSGALTEVCSPADAEAWPRVREPNPWVVAGWYDEGRILQIGDYLIGDENCSLLYGLPIIRY